MRTALSIASILTALVAVFYAFNAYIQFRERGFAEALDIPIAVVAAIAAVALFIASRRR